jgi:hypothetical protein
MGLDKGRNKQTKNEIKTVVSGLQSSISTAELAGCDCKNARMCHQYMAAMLALLLELPQKTASGAIAIPSGIDAQQRTYRGRVAELEWIQSEIPNTKSVDSFGW